MTTDRSPVDAVRADGITLTYGNQVAIAEASFTVPAGRVTAVIGPNGSGKSTILHAVAGLHRPRQGSLTVLGGSSWEPTSIAFVPQATRANDQLPVSAREVVAMGRYAHRGFVRRFTAADHHAVDRAMERLDIERFARRQIARLSGGERQRVLVAQALAQETPLLLLDEPLSGLDLPSQERILRVIAEERDAGRTVIVSTHSLAEAARADHLLLLAGRVVAEGPKDDVLTDTNLRAAYGGMIVRVGDSGSLLIDDGSHHT